MAQDSNKEIGDQIGDGLDDVSQVVDPKLGFWLRIAAVLSRFGQRLASKK